MCHYLFILTLHVWSGLFNFLECSWWKFPLVIILNHLQILAAFFFFKLSIPSSFELFMVMCFLSADALATLPLITVLTFYGWGSLFFPPSLRLFNFNTYYVCYCFFFLINTLLTDCLLAFWFLLICDVWQTAWWNNHELTEWSDGSLPTNKMMAFWCE